MFVGQLVLFLMNSHLGLGIGLFLLVIGNGFFKPNISTIVGQLYREGDPKKDAAFSIFYMGINLGALLAPLVIGVLAEDMFAVKGVDADGKAIILSYGFKYGFLVAAIGMALGQITFNLLAKKYLLELGTKPTKLTKEEKQAEQEKPAATVDPALRKIERQRLAVIFILTFFVIFFWAGFEQAGSSLTLYTDKYIDRVVGGWEIPTTFFQAFNPILIVAMAPIFAWLWTTKLFAKMSTPVKMSLGMILLGVGFLFMLMATFEVKTSGAGEAEVVQQKAALIWLLLTYFLHTIGELCLSPVGLSMVTKMAPVRLVSLMMGVWMLSSFFANIIGGFISKYTQVLGAYTIFSSIALFVIVLGLVLLIISKRISKLMNGVV
jgi:POT family proton-dependent oligopeptide transporter